MSNIMAAIGIEQLKKIDVLSQRRKKYANLYSKGFKGCNKVTCLQQDYVSVVPHIYTIVLTQGISRAELRKYLDDRGIQTGIHYQPNHELALYRNTSDAPLLNTADIAERIVTLPLHPDLVEDDVKYVIDSVSEFLSSS